MKQMKYIAILAVTLAMLFGLAIWSVAQTDEALSQSERRKLAQMPELTVESVLDCEYMEDLETYLLDQFPMRDSWRAVKAVLRFNVFRQKDSNGVYLVGKHVLKQEPTLKEEQVRFAVDKINEFITNNLEGMNVSYAVVPDKNYFAAEQNGYPHLDYGEMLSIAQGINASYIDIFPLLELDDYYYTDAHWKQEQILDVAQLLADGMGLGVSLQPEGGYTTNTLAPFYGVYYGQSALSVEADVLSYLTSAATDAATMTSVELEGEHPVYTVERFEGMDGYDVFAAGAQAIVTIESPNATTDKELIIFRDSYGSSIAPLFLEGYAKVTLIDLRYVASALVPQFVEFDNQDVLFLYSTSILNSGMLLK